MSSMLEHAVATQERAITAPAPLFVRACPGAGKTHVIVSRHLRGPAAVLRHGRALVSFTRAAATQMRRRCHREGRPEATAFPHYIGTVDAFIWDILTEPHRRADSPLQLLDSWDRVQAVVKLDRQVPLSAFTFQRDPQAGRESIRRDLLSPEHNRRIDGSTYRWERWSSAAFAARRSLVNAGYVTGHESRLLALRYLSCGEGVLYPLRSRFAEIVVDEAQDCSVTDLEILGRLHGIGIPMVVVADPDQMIYGWRDADPGRLRALEGNLGQTIHLDGNWRSSTTVCQLAATLRAGSRPPDLAVRPPQTEPAVILLPTQFPRSGQAWHVPSRRAVVDVFLDHARNWAIDAAGCLITAYRRAHLPTRSRRPVGNSATVLAYAWRVVHSATADPDLLNDACLSAARLLLRYWYPHVTAQGSVQALCAAAGVEYRELVRRAYAFLHALPRPHADWPRDVNPRLKSWPRPPKAAPKGVTGQLRSKPDKLSASGAAPALYRADNIHQVKGDEHAGVLLLLPDDDASTRWIDGDPATDELLRNWYVAVTRTQKLLAIGIQEDHLDVLAEYLRTRQIPILIG
jgi:ATP-dependent DNA helicase UvrD/PcrA